MRAFREKQKRGGTGKGRRRLGDSNPDRFGWVAAKGGGGARALALKPGDPEPLDR